MDTLPSNMGHVPGTCDLKIQKKFIFISKQ